MKNSKFKLRVKFWKTVLGLILLGMGSSARPLIADECKDALVNGVFDELNLKTSSERKSTFEKLLSMDIDLLETSAREEGKEGQLALSILKVVSLGIGGESNKKMENLKKLRESFRSNEKQFYQSSDFVELAQRVANPSILAAWERCMSNKLQATYVDGWHADDPLGVGRITVRYAKTSPEVLPSIPITAVTTNNVILLAQETTGWFRKKTLPAIRVGKKIKLYENLSTTFERIDPDKPASIVVSFGGYGDVDLRFPANPIVTPTNIPPTKEAVTKRVEKIGGKRISGGDKEMDTDPGDVVTCTFWSELKFDAQKVWISADYSCEEYKGNHTKLGVALKDEVLYTAPSDKKIVGIEHLGEAVFMKNPRVRGRNHGFNEMAGTKNTYWTTLTHRVDSSGKNDAPAVGFKGVVSFAAKLESK